MAGPWDSVAKRMIGANPGHFVKWLASEATFVEEGRLQEQREMLRDFLQLRFPETIALAKQQTNSIKDPEVLRTVLTKLFAAQTVEEVKQILLDVNKQ